VFATRLETIPAPCPLPPVPPALVKEWEAKLGPRRRPRVGIAWSGSAAHQNDRNRSIPLRQMLALAALPVDLVSMQPELDAQDAAVLTASNAHLTHFGTQLADFLETAALVSLMDTVVAVDTAVAHLAGALGRATWILLPSALRVGVLQMQAA
jgi:ADP-heptose:LPS heptosyltransferase